MQNKQSYDAFKASSRYVFSPENRVTRIPASKQQNAHKTDLREKFKKLYRERQNAK